MKGVETIAIDTREPYKGLLQLFTTHALHRIAPQAFDLADDSHLGSFSPECGLPHHLRTVYYSRNRLLDAGWPTNQDRPPGPSSPDLAFNQVSDLTLRSVVGNI